MVILRRPVVLPRCHFSDPGTYVFPLVEGNRDIVEVDRRESFGQAARREKHIQISYGASLTPSTCSYCNGTRLRNGAQGRLHNLTMKFDLSD